MVTVHEYLLMVQTRSGQSLAQPAALCLPAGIVSGFLIMAKFWRMLLCALVSLVYGGVASAAPEILETDRFGQIEIFRPAGTPTQVALWLRGAVAGEGGVVIRDSLLEQGFVVAGIDADRYRDSLKTSGGCTQFGEFVRLNQVVQNRLALSRLVRPVLLGSGSGADLAYAVALANGSEFSGLVVESLCRGIVTLGAFCDARLLEGQDKSEQLQFPVHFPPSLPGIVIRPVTARTCAVTDKPFNPEADTTSVTKLTASDPLFSGLLSKAIADRFPQPGLAAENTAVDTEFLEDLELVELPADPPGKRLMIFLSGDGGWAAIDKELGGYFQEQGINVVGFSSLRFFWKAKTPEETAHMLAQVISHYEKIWHSSQVLLAGFSLGADVLPSAYNRLPAKIKRAVDGMILLNPEKRIAFEVKLTDWLNIDSGEGMDGLPELLKVRIPLICVYGEQEIKDTLCTQLPSGVAQVIQLKGGHHFDGDYRALGARLLELSRPIPE